MQINSFGSHSFFHDTRNARNHQTNNERSWYCPDEYQYVNENTGRRLGWWTGLTVFEDDAVRVSIVNRNNTNLSLGELQERGLTREVSIWCKRTNALVIIDNVELADKFWNKFKSFLHENDLNILDFIEWARNPLLCDLLGEFIERMGWRVSHHTFPPEVDMEELIRDVLSGELDLSLLGKPDFGGDDDEDEPIAERRLAQQVKREIPIMSDEEILQMVPDPYNKLKSNMFYERYYNHTDE